MKRRPRKTRQLSDSGLSLARRPQSAGGRAYGLATTGLLDPALPFAGVLRPLQSSQPKKARP